MTTQQIIELAIAIVALAAGVWLYRKPRGPESAPDQYGSQSAVLLFALAGILIVHLVIAARAHSGTVDVEAVAQ